MNFKIQELLNRLDELTSHLNDSQGNDLKSRLDALRKPKMVEDDIPDDLKPKGIEIKKVSVLGKPENYDDKVDEAIRGEDDAENPLLAQATDSERKPDELGKGSLTGSDEDEMTDDELDELVAKYLKANHS